MTRRLIMFEMRKDNSLKGDPDSEAFNFFSKKDI